MQRESVDYDRRAQAPDFKAGAPRHGLHSSQEGGMPTGPDPSSPDWCSVGAADRVRLCGNHRQPWSFMRVFVVSSDHRTVCDNAI